MPVQDPVYVALIADAFRKSDAAASVYDRGLLLEGLIRTLFEKLSGVRHWRSRHLTAAGDAEFDVCFQNDVRVSSLHMFGHVLVVEAKNTGSAIDSASVRAFVSKLDDAHVGWGVLVAAQGITGGGTTTSHAHNVIRESRARKVNVIVITRDELTQLKCHEEFEALLVDKIMSHTLMRPLF